MEYDQTVSSGCGDARTDRHDTPYVVVVISWDLGRAMVHRLWMRDLLAYNANQDVLIRWWDEGRGAV
jgi:hypothetical protein